MPGLTTEQLQRIVSCHHARNAAMGFGLPSMFFGPLSVRGVRPTVVLSDAGFRVETRASDADAEVYRRARALVPGN
ncbi:MAG: hypothetical protein ACHREM_15585 [Polyangiales bacterium]